MSKGPGNSKADPLTTYFSDAHTGAIRAGFCVDRSRTLAVAAVLDERDLVAHFGRDYVLYQRQVGMFLPRRHRTTDRDLADRPAAAAVSVSRVSHDGNLRRQGN